MLKTFFILSAFYCLVVLCSYQKEIVSIIETPLDTSDIPASESYIPLGEGTFWVYKDSATGNNDTATVLADEWLHDNITFKKVQVKSGADESYSYYGVRDNNYYIYGEENGVNITMLVLNDLADAGSSWVYDMGLISGVPARGTGTVVEKNTTTLVQGKTYQNVIHTKYVMAYNIRGNYIGFATYDFHFAKGIGVIKVQSSVTDGNGAVAVTKELIDYAIE